MSLQTLLVCDEDLSTRRQIESLITGAPELLYVGTCDGANAQRYINNSGAKLVWIDLGKDPEKSLHLLGDLKHASPGVHFLVSHDKWEPGLEKISSQLGAFEFLDPLTWGEKWIPIIKALQSYELEQKILNAVPREQAMPPVEAPVQEDPEEEAAPEHTGRPKFSASRTGMPAMKAAKFLPKWFVPATVAVVVLTVASYFIFH